MQVLPSLDLERGRSRLVFWPGAASGSGVPTDRPERIARHFVELGAPVIHLVDLDGAKAGAPVNLDVVGRIAAEVSVPIQVAGGVDGPEQIRLAFAAGATRVVLPLLAVAEKPDVLHACLDVAGSWLAVGLDPRPERLREYPWRQPVVSTLDELIARLADSGVQRFVVSHAGASPDLETLRRWTGRYDAEFLVAGGLTDLAWLPRLREAGVRGAIVGQALISGQLDYQAAARAAA